VDWEIEHHLAEQTEVLISQGYDPVGARREAERRFGNVTRHRRRLARMEIRGRIMRGAAELGIAMRSVWTLTLRTILRSPGLSVTIALTLGLGIGVNTVMFSVVDRLLLRPPDHVTSPDQVKRILVHGTLFGSESTLPALTYADVQDLRSVPLFASVGASSNARQLTLGRGSDATRVRAVLATSDFFLTLGVSPRLGRFFDSRDDEIGSAGTVVVNEEFWERALGRDPGILGRTLEIDGHSFTVIGVAPKGFSGIDLSPVDVWLPALPTEFLRRGNDGFVTSRGSYWLQAVVRMAKGASTEVAEVRATALHVGGRADRIETGRFNPNTQVLITPLIEARGPTASATSRTALWLGGVSLIVLIIACTNVVNLLLAQASRRKRETAIRTSLGASRPRLLAGMVLEGLLLSLLGGLAALALAQAGGELVQRVLLPDIAWSGTMMSGRTVWITLLLSVSAGILTGLGPAAQSTRLDPSRELKEGGRGATQHRSRIQAALTVAQAAMSVVLLVGAGLFLRSMEQVRTLDLGVDVDRLILAVLETQGETSDATDLNRLYGEAMERVSRMPGVEGVALTDVVFQSYARTDLRLPGIDSLPIPQGVGPLYFSVTPGYLQVLGLSILRGRSLEEADREGAPRVAVVNERMAGMLWPDGDALGACFYFDGGDECTTVVGVVENGSVGEIDGNQWLAYYLPISQTGFTAEGLYVRADDDVRELAAAVAPVLRTFSPSVRYADVRTLRQTLEPQSRSWTLGSALFSAFGLLALLVATIGLYSLLSFDVVQRTREIGIRRALGAERGQVLGEVMFRGGRLAALGCFAGLGISLVLGPLVQPLLFQVDGRDPWVLTGVVLGLLTVGLVSSIPPALRATRIDPLEALRQE